MHTFAAQCLAKLEAQNAQLPPEQRKPIPKKPVAVGGGSLTREEANEAAWEAQKSAMVPCPKCGRTFSAHDRMAIHLKGCKEGGGAGGGGGADAKTSYSPSGGDGLGKTLTSTPPRM